jgi:hypothetical protein
MVISIAGEDLLIRFAPRALATLSDYRNPDVLTELIQMLLPQCRIRDAHVTGPDMSKAELPGRFGIGALDEETRETVALAVLPVVQQRQDAPPWLTRQYHRRANLKLAKYTQEVRTKVAAEVIEIERRMMQAMAQANRVATSVRAGIGSLRFAHDRLIVAPKAGLGE